MKWTISISGIILLVTAFNTPVLAEMTPKEILASSDMARGNVGGIEWKIDIESVGRGRKQDRSIIVKARGHNSLAEFISPPKVKGQKLLMIDRNMWFVKPGLRKPVPISPRQKLMGGAANGDIASTNYAGDYESESVSDGIFNGEACYLLDLRATNKKATYDRIIYWVSKKRLVGVKADFYTVSGKQFKSAVFEYTNSITVNDIARPFVSKMTIMDAVIEENITVMTYGKVTIKGVPDSVFNLNLLVR